MTQQRNDDAEVSSGPHTPESFFTGIHFTSEEDLIDKLGLIVAIMSITIIALYGGLGLPL